MKPVRTLGRKAVALVAAAFAMLGTGALPAHAQEDAASYTPNELDFVLLQPQIKKFRLPIELRGYQTPAGVCVDLADVIQSLDLAIRLDKKSRRATGWIFEESRSFTLDRDSNTVQIVNTTSKLQPGELYDSPEGWCVDTDTLAEWLDLSVTSNLYESALVLESDKPLPFMEAIERQSRAARLRPKADADLSGYPQAPQDYAIWRMPSVDAVVRGGYDRSGGRSRTQLRYELFASGEVAKASYNLRLASDEKGAPQSLRLKAFRMDPAGEMLGPLKATQVAAGDVELPSGNLAGGPGVGRGAFVSNRPIFRPSRFGETVVRGTLPIGWDAELYRNGQLLALQGDSADGRYEFTVELLYGRNDLEIVLYGPQGQVRREAQSIPVGLGAIEQGKFEYWAGVIQRNTDLISFGARPPGMERGWHYGAGVEYGLDKRTILGSSAQSMFIEGAQRHYAELTLQRSLGRMLVNMSAAQEIGRGRAFRLEALGRFGEFNVQVESFFVDGGFTSGLVGEDEKQEHSFRLDHSLKLGRVPLPLSVSYRRNVRRDGLKVNEFLGRASLILPRLALTGFFLHKSTEGGISSTDGARAGLLANTRVFGINVRGEAQFRLTGGETGFEAASLTLETGLSHRSDLRFEIEHSARHGNTDFELGYVHQFDKFALRGSANAGTDGNYGLNLALAFSFGPDPLGGGLRFSNEKLAQRGQAAVSVFLDKDGDGFRSASEDALEGVGITAGQHGSADPTDERGFAFVEGLNPYEKVLVSVDESTLPDPFLMPRGKGVVVTPRPGVAAVIELAVAPTGEVEGVLYGVEDTPRPGVELELVDEGGAVAARTISEFDGFFLFDRVAYGSYKLRVAETSAKVLDVKPSLADGIRLDTEQTLVRLETIRLVARSIASAPPTGPPTMALAETASGPAP